MIDPKDLDVFVLATRHRPAIITNYLSGIQHTVHMNPDYHWEPNLPLIDGLVKMAWNPLNMYRAFRGHVDILRMSTKPFTLVLEDDARPNRDDWFDIVRMTDEVLKDAEIASLHGRDFDPRELDYKNSPGVKDKIIAYKNEELIFTKPHPMHNDTFKRTWCLGSCMAYVITDKAKHIMTNYKYDGLPIDFIVPSKFDFFVLRNTCFIHDRVHGTLMT